MTKPSSPTVETASGSSPCEALTGTDIRHGYLDGETFENRPVTYTVIDGRSIFEGDIVIDARLRSEPAGAAARAMPSVEIEQREGVIERAIVVSDSGKRWPNGLLPFEIDPGLPAAQRTAVTDAIAHWRLHSRIGFIERTAQNAANHPDFVRFVAGAGCSSAAGRNGNGRQDITLGAGCLRGQAIHEIGHALGLWHEQSREDRGNFVTINWGNIDPAQLPNFVQHISDGDDVGEYDYGSIMHYGSNAFSMNGQPTIVPKQAGAVIGQRNGLSAFDTAAIRSIYRGLQPPNGLTLPGDFTGDGHIDLLSYIPSRFNWWLGVRSLAGMVVRDVGSTAGFGQLGDGRPFWVGDFNGDGRDDVLFYTPGDDNWWLGTFNANGTSLAWSLAGNTLGFGHGISDGRPFWSGRFSRRDATEILFYYPGDDNWWLGSMANGKFVWSLAGNTHGFGHAINDGRPFWTADFTGDGRNDVLFYYPGDDNWWLGTFNGKSLSWSFAGNTRGFGHRINDGRPFWIDDFNGDGKSEVLFYYPGDDNWWLGTFSGSTLNWTLVGNTKGFGHNIRDGRPFWTGRFADKIKASVMFYYPADGKYWMGTIVNGQLVWVMAGDF